MHRKVYNYNATVTGQITLRVLGVVLVFCMPVLFRSIAASGPAVRSDLMWTDIFFASLVTFYLIFGILRLMGLLRESITIENGQITYIDRHSRKITCALTDVISIETVDSDLRDGPLHSWRNQADMYRAVTTSGNIWFYPSIDNFADLQKSLADGAARHAAMHPNDITEGVPL